ncbi:ArsR family transcriptional regulator [Dyella dinghuensis]|uniref:ArsR family transcriptional regulator n=1 Tax=Dyella dinghuensis TaxID=1920169 RepID=A0A432LV98_9GAMM|nr:ArsR family transcriptional regulator [Dyella dinghuensis]
MNNSPARKERSPLDCLFHVLADPTRRAMLLSLAVQGRNITELASLHKVTFPAASKHVKMLESAGLVSRRLVGKKHVLRAMPLRLVIIDEWLQLQLAFGLGRDGPASAALSHSQSDLNPMLLPSTGNGAIHASAIKT